MRLRPPIEGTATAVCGLLLCSVLLLAPACASQPNQRALPPQTMAPPGPEIEEPVSNTPPEEPPEPGTTAVEPPADSTAGANEAEVDPQSADDEITVVIEPPSGQTEQPKSLFAAAQAERARRARAGDSTIVITDKNLAEHAAGGQLTFVEEDDEESDEPSTADPTEEGSHEEALEDLAEDEAYWRDRVGDLRQTWRDAIDRISELEERIAALRQDFYAEDDPFYRDSQIKPAWDRALEELEESRREARRAEEDLASAIEEGRRAGALPGWLREGLDLEPTAEELEAVGEGEDEDRFHQPSEPVVLDEEEDGPGTGTGTGTGSGGGGRR